MKIKSPEPVKTQTYYCLEIETGYFDKIIVKDRNSNFKHQTLIAKLEALGVEGRTIEFDGHFGPFVHYALEPDNDTPEMHKKIRRAIQGYCR